MDTIELHAVGKTFRIPHQRRTGLADHTLHLFRRAPVEAFAALRDVNLRVPPGSFVGIIGTNGSGKSTLLKIVAGLLAPDAGEVRVRGTLAPLLELGLGFHAGLTASENVALYGAILGYPARETARRVDTVLEFAELERFRGAKLRSFSSGMIARLAIATALQADADIVLLDEILAVGDARFQQKCLNAFEALKKERRTIVLVSHDMGAVQGFCDQVVWLDGGRVVASGEPQTVVRAYLDAARREAEAASARRATTLAGEPVRRFGDQRATFVSGGLEDAAGRPVVAVRSGSRVVLRLTAEFHAACIEPVFGFGLRQIGALGSHIVYTVNNEQLGMPSGRFVPGERLEIRIPFTAMLMNGHYTIFVMIAPRDDGWESTTFHDWINDFVTFSVEDDRCYEGLADLDAAFHCHTLPTRVAHAGLVHPS